MSRSLDAGGSRRRRGSDVARGLTTRDLALETGGIDEGRSVRG